MLPVFRVHVYRAGSPWAWAMSRGRGPTASTRIGAAASPAVMQEHQQAHQQVS